MAESGESFEIQIEELTQALAVRTSERDTLAGRLKEQVAEVQELKVLAPTLKAIFEKETSCDRPWRPGPALLRRRRGAAPHHELKRQ